MGAFAAACCGSSANAGIENLIASSLPLVLGLQVPPQRGVRGVGDEVLELVRVGGQVEQLGPLIVAGVADELGGLGPHRRHRGDAISALVEVAIEIGLPPVVILCPRRSGRQLRPCISLGIATPA